MNTSHNINLKKEIYILSITGALAVGLGAFGSHGLKSILTETQLHTYQTGISYHFYHVLAMMGVLIWWNVTGNNALKISFYLFFSGIIMFSGSLYLLSTADATDLGINQILGPVTPIGGLLFILGWLSLFRIKS